MSVFMSFMLGLWVGALLGAGFAVLLVGTHDSNHRGETADEKAFNAELREWDSSARWQGWGEAR